MDERDVRWSLMRLVRYVADQEGISAPIQPLMASVKVERPVILVVSLPGGSNERVTKNFTFNSMRFQIQYLTDDYDAAELFIVALRRFLENRHWKFPGILRDFKYPSPGVYGRSGAGSLTPGPLYVAVTGLNHVDVSEETLTSRPQLVNLVGAQDTVRLVIPRHPGNFNWFSHYNVYAGATASELKKTADSPVAAHESLTTVYDLLSMPAGADPPTESKQIQYRFIDIPPEMYSANVIRGMSMEGDDIIGMVSLVLRAPVSAMISQGEPIESVGIEVYPRPTISLGVTSLNLTTYRPNVIVTT